jgi:glycerol-3-phosphate acyltransferase PlsX
LGIRGACIICHGSSGDRAIKNALRVANAMAEDHINTQIIQHLGAKLDHPDDLPEGEIGAQS